MSLSFPSKLNCDSSLYVITIELPGKSHRDVAIAAIKGGASIIQYREKGISTRRLLETAMKLRQITGEAGAKLIINDRVDIALAVGADGVHLGQNDLPLRDARGIMGNNYIIGISATNYDEAIIADRDGADYIGLGPVFPTPSKDDAAPPMGLEVLTDVAQSVKVPIIAIGGITTDNVEEVIRSGADGVAVISAIAAADDMAAAASLICRRIKHARERSID